MRFEMEDYLSPPGDRGRYTAYQNCHMVELNPYAAPAEGSLIHTSEFTRGSKKGPALYIVFSTLSVTFIAMLFLQRLKNEHQLIGLGAPAVGCIVGALIYRIRSRQWPVDPTAKSRIIKYSLVACVTPPIIALMVTSGGHAHGRFIVLIFALVGLSIAAGIILSGRRRDGELQARAAPPVAV